MVVSSALRAIGRLAAGMKEHFVPYHRQMFPLVVARFKDKKVVSDVDFCLDQFALCQKLDDIADEIKETLTDKSPAIRIHICKWLERTLADGANISVAKGVAESGLMSTLLQFTEEAVGEVRDSSLACVGHPQSSGRRNGVSAKVFI